MFQDQVRNFVTSLVLFFFWLDRTFFNFCTSKLFCFFITLIFIIFYNRNRVNFIVIVLLLGRKIIYVIAPAISFFLKIVSFYFKSLKFLIILIFIFNHPHIHSPLILLPLNHMASETQNC